MATKTKSFGQSFYDRQIEYLQANDVDGLIENQYNDDAELISFDIVVRGKEALKRHFRAYLKNLPGLHLESTEKFRETEEAIFFEATISIDAGGAKVYDAFVLRDGKASHHFTGVLAIFPRA